MKHFEILRDENGKFFAVKVTGKAYLIFNILIVVVASNLHHNDLRRQR